MDQAAEYDFDRYRKLLAEAVDEPRRLALIDLLIRERARDRLKHHLVAGRKAMTARTVADILVRRGPDPAPSSQPGAIARAPAGLD